MSAKSAKSLLSSRIVSLLKSEKWSIKNSELSLFESTLKDDLVRHNWLYSLLNAAINNCAVISSADLNWLVKTNNYPSLNCLSSMNSYSSHHDLSSVDVNSLDSLRSEIALNQQKISLLKKQKEWLKKQVCRVKSEVTTEKENFKYSLLELKVKELLVRLDQANKDEFSFPNTNDVVESMVSHLNANFEGLNDNEVDDLLNELSLVSREHDKQLIVASFYEKYFERLSFLRERLVAVQGKCKQLLDFYNDVVRKELSWRKEMKLLSQELEGNICALQERHSHCTFTHNDVLASLSNVQIPNHDLHDELNELLDRLKEKVSLL